MSDTMETAVPELDDAKFKDACSQGIALCRKLKHRLMEADEDATREFSTAMGRLMAEAGTTLEEARHYMHRILLMVLSEPQA